MIKYGVGYITVTAKQVLSPKEREDAIARAKEHYSIWRLEENGGSITPTNPQGPCLPSELVGQSQPAQARVVMVQVVSKTDYQDMVPLAFEKWQGVNY